jgi:hypothetical protein
VELIGFYSMRRKWRCLLIMQLLKSLKLKVEDRYNRFAITLTMFDVSFKGASCSVIESKVLKSCEECNLKFLCKKIDVAVED